MLNTYISTTEASHILEVSRITIFNWVKSKKINAKKVGRNYIILKKDIEEIREKGLIMDTQKKMLQNFVEMLVSEYDQIVRQD